MLSGVHATGARCNPWIALSNKTNNDDDTCRVSQISSFWGCRWPYAGRQRPLWLGSPDVTNACHVTLSLPARRASGPPLLRLPPAQFCVWRRGHRPARTALQHGVLTLALRLCVKPWAGALPHSQNCGPCPTVARLIKRVLFSKPACRSSERETVAASMAQLWVRKMMPRTATTS